MRGDKAKKIRELLTEFGSTFNDREIAEMADSTQSFVYKLRSKERVKAKLKDKVPTIKTKRLGRPAKAKTPVVEVTKQPSIVDACHTLINALQQHKNLYISFDNSRTTVEVMWNDDVYHVSPEEVTRIAECVDYLESHRLTYVL